ncbi:MAG: type VI secretion system tip protein VgrG [Aquabacterium sp.]|nr:MAG: type VI secretion system tip protein VgrG [Aquabacterium sp.]
MSASLSDFAPGSGAVAAAMAVPESASSMLSSPDRLPAALSSLGAAALEALSAAFTDARRLYALEGVGGAAQDGDALSQLLVESWVGDEALGRPYAWRICALSRDAALPPEALVARAARLRITLADGRRTSRSGLVQVAEALEADGGFARYRLTLVPWLQLLAHRRASRLWQDSSVQQIVDDLFAPYVSHAAWSWSDEVAAELAASPDGGVRGLRVQYRETDLDFLQRLLAEEGLGYRFEEDDAAPAGHRLVIFADSVQLPADATSDADGGIRFHRSSSQEASDAIQAFGGVRVLPAARTTMLSWDGYAQQSSHTTLDAAAGHAGEQAPVLEYYTLASALPNLSTELSSPTAAHLPRRAALLAQAQDARHKTWLGRSSVRSLRAGTQFDLRQSTLDALDTPDGGDVQRKRFTTLRVLHAGINNLPKALNDHLAATLGEAFEGWAEEGLSTPADDGLPELPPTAELLAQARSSGYANRFLAVRAAIAWRPPPPPPRHAGLQTAIVVGPEGEVVPALGDIHTDLLGRVRVKFHWQNTPDADPRADNRLSCWMRVVQRWAGPGAGAGLGAQFIPRIGQEVLVEFIDGDVEHPIVVGAVHNGRGEGGTAATPGGREPSAPADDRIFSTSTDHRAAAQGNEVASYSGGNAPAWHGAAPGSDTQAQAAALSGWRSNEFGNRAGTGHNQLLFDDSDGQLAVQAGSTQHATWLNLGHLLHRADNHRGSLRGLGLELRTDAYGSVRAGQGLLLSTWGIADHEPALDHAAGSTLAKQQQQLAERFSEAARAHRTVQLATTIGSTQAGGGTLDDHAAPLAALHQAASGMASSQTFGAATADASAKTTAAAQDKLPHTTDPIVAIAAKSGLGLTAGQDLQLSANDTLHLAAGQDLHQASGGALRIHTGQAVGLLAGAIAGNGEAAGTGITAIAAGGDVVVQAQNAAMHLAAKEDLRVQSASAFVDFAAAKRVVLRTAGGACVTLEGGQVTVECPGKITVLAATKSMVGPQDIGHALPQLPRSSLPDRAIKFDLRLADAPGSAGHGLGHLPWAIVRGQDEPEGMALLDPEDIVLQGQTDANGTMPLSAAEQLTLQKAYCAHPGRLWLMYPGHCARLDVAHESPEWTNDERLRHLMGAADFSAEVHRYAGSEGLQEQLRYARELLESPSIPSLLQRLKSS